MKQRVKALFYVRIQTVKNRCETYTVSGRIVHGGVVVSALPIAGVGIEALAEVGAALVDLHGGIFVAILHVFLELGRGAAHRRSAVMTGTEGEGAPSRLRPLPVPSGSRTTKARSCAHVPNPDPVDNARPFKLRTSYFPLYSINRMA